MLDLYINIKNRRKELEISQQTLAEMVGYSGKSMISKVERGEVDLSTTMIKKFADALKTTPSQLMGWPGEEIISDDAIIDAEMSLDVLWKRIYLDFKKLSEDEKNEVAAFVRFKASQASSEQK